MEYLQDILRVPSIFHNCLHCPTIPKYSVEDHIVESQHSCDWEQLMPEITSCDKEKLVQNQQKQDACHPVDQTQRWLKHKLWRTIKWQHITSCSTTFSQLLRQKIITIDALNYVVQAHVSFRVCFRSHSWKILTSIHTRFVLSQFSNQNRH